MICMQAVSGSAVAAAVAAGILLAPMPAEAKLTFGRAADVAEQQVQHAVTVRAPQFSCRPVV